MVSAEHVIELAERLGVTMTVIGDRIQYRPASAAPPEFVEILRQNKFEVMNCLRPKFCVEALTRFCTVR